MAGGVGRRRPRQQRFAVKTSKTIESISSKAARARELADQIKDVPKKFDDFRRQ